jgi:hypothetical protein
MKQEENSVIGNSMLSASIVKVKWTCRLVEVNGFLAEDPWRGVSWMTETEMEE